MFSRKSGLLTVLGFSFAAVGFSAWLMAQPKPADRGLSEDKLRPRWNVGDSWVVEAETKPVQARNAAAASDDDKAEKVEWKFTVSRVEKLAGQECYVLEITAVQDPKTQPRTKLWIDKKALAVRQM